MPDRPSFRDLLHEGEPVTPKRSAKHRQPKLPVAPPPAPSPAPAAVYNQACPKCGCQDGRWLGPEPVETGGYFAPSRRRQCRHCGRVFRAAIIAQADAATPEPPRPADMRRLPEVPYVRTKCPHCASLDTAVTHKKRGGVRLHTCNACKKTFRSKEQKE